MPTEAFYSLGRCFNRYSTHSRTSSKFIHWRIIQQSYDPFNHRRSNNIRWLNHQFRSLAITTNRVDLHGRSLNATDNIWSSKHIDGCLLKFHANEYTSSFGLMSLLFTTSIKSRTRLLRCMDKYVASTPLILRLHMNVHFTDGTQTSLSSHELLISNIHKVYRATRVRPLYNKDNQTMPIWQQLGGNILVQNSAVLSL
jgi:hypothetical protein